MYDVSHIIGQFRSLNLDKVIDFDKFNQYAIVHHSSSIEGSTLTENETRLLLDEGITPKGKPLEHSLMVKDHFEALQYTLSAAREKQPVDTRLIQTINSKVMKQTGRVYNTVFGEIDASKGMFRKGNVSAGGSYFVGYDKVEPYTKQLAEKLMENLSRSGKEEDQLKISFAAHFDLVSIHPFYDGNGRTSRLLMNYVQQYFGLPLGIVFKEDKVDYFTALQEARKKENIDIFHEFMFYEYKKFLEQEITIYNQSLLPKGKGFSIFF